MPTITKVPVVDSLAGEDFLEEGNILAMIPVPTKLTKPDSKYFLIRIDDSALNLFTISGTKAKKLCYALVRRERSAEHGEAIVAFFEGELMLRVYENAHGIEILRPHSTDASYTPAVLTEPCNIKGVVVAILPSNLY